MQTTANENRISATPVRYRSVKTAIADDQNLSHSLIDRRTFEPAGRAEQFVVEERVVY